MDSLRTLLPFLKPYRWHMLIVILSAFTVTASSLVTPWIIRDVVRLINESDETLVAGSIAGFVVFLAIAHLLRALTFYLRNYVAHIMAWNTVSDIQAAVYAHLQTLSLGFYTRRQTGELVSRVTSDTRDLEPVLAHSIPDLLVYATMITGICGLLFTINPLLTVLVLIPMPFLALAVRRFVKGEHEGFMKALSCLSLFHAKVQDNLSGIKEIQVFAQEWREGQHVRKLAKDATDIRLYALKMQALIPSSVELAAGVGMVLIVWVGSGLASAGTMPLEDLIAFILYVSLLYEPIRVLAYTNEGLQTSLAGARRIADLLTIESDVADPQDGIAPETVRGAVTFENIHFSYLNSVPVLRDISITVQPGQVMALVGPTGAGKSTLTSLVARFYDPQKGQIRIDGNDIRKLRLSSLRQNISMVLQDVFLFNGTVRDNIRFGKPDATDADIIEAATVASAHDFIAALPDGYDTQIGERGLKLSGGQKQRLAIARAVLKDAPILILDEATSSVDTQTEADIQEALARLMRGRTSIVIAHRLSTIKDADFIAVLDDGHITELGRHDDLMESSGLYRQLYEKQFKEAS